MASAINHSSRQMHGPRCRLQIHQLQSQHTTGIAAILFAVVRTYAIELVPHSWQMILGITLLAIIIFLPKGLWSLFSGQARAAKAVEAKA